MPNYYIRRNNRRATIDARIEDNWVELDTPEFTLATSSPAISVPGGKLGVHFGRMGVTLSNAIPHGGSHANTLLHGQVTRRYSSDVTTSGWSSFLTSERKEPRTRSAFALVNNIASVIAFAPNPGSPPTKQISLPKTSASSRVVWHNLFPPNETSEQGEASDPADDDIPELTVSHASEEGDDSASSISDASEPSIASTFEPSQILILGPRTVLYESPVPLTSGTRTPTYTIDIDEQQLANMFAGSGSSYDFSGSRALLAATASSTDPYLLTERQKDFPVSIHLSSTDEYRTPVGENFPQNAIRDSWHTADWRERKLLIIGSRYDPERRRSATTFTFASELDPLDGTHDDVQSLKSLFRKRAYSVETFVGEEFDKEAVLEKLSDFLRSAQDGDIRAIIFTGHALRTLDNIVAIVPPHCPNKEDVIPAKEWEETVKLNTKPGVIVLSIFASCSSGELMPQKISLKPLSNISEADISTPSDVPIFITLASCGPYEYSYESVVGLKNDCYRMGDHFLRALTLAIRESSAKDWQSLIAALDVKFAEIRQVGAICAAKAITPSLTWLEDSPQNPVLTSSDPHLPLYESVFPSEISLIERPSTPMTNPINISDEFLAHISLRVSL